MNLKAIPQLLKDTFFCLALATGLSSCNKEYPDLPYNNIEAFTIEDANGKPLHAVVKDEDIIVYWTPLQDEPTFITPSIRVSERAQISPASGEKVAYSEETKYTVTAQDGRKKTYTLRTQGGQPAPYFSLVNNSDFMFNNIFAISGDYFLPEVEKTRVYLVQGNKETAITDIRGITNSLIRMYIPLTTDIDTGRYHIKLVTGKRIVNNGPYRLQPPKFNSLIDRTQLPATGTPGQTISLDLRDQKGASYYKNEQYEIIFTYDGQEPLTLRDLPRLEGTKLKIKIPEDAPKGNLLITVRESKTKIDRYFIYFVIE